MRGKVNRLDRDTRGRSGRSAAGTSTSLNFVEGGGLDSRRFRVAAKCVDAFHLSTRSIGR